MFRLGVFLGLLLVGELVLPGPARAQSSSDAMLLESPDSRQLLERGRRQLMAGYLKPAENTFRRLSDQPDGAPAAYHHLATVSLLRVILYDRPGDYEAFFSRSDSLRDVLSNFPRSVGQQFLAAETDFQRSLAWAKQGSHVRSAMAAVSAYRALDELANSDGGFVEAQKTLGMIHTTLGTLPRRYRRFLSIFGLTTEIEAGLDQVALAADSSQYGRDEALLFLSILDSFELPSRVHAAETLSELFETHDRSPLFGMVLVDALLRARRVDEADAILRRLEDPPPGRIDIDYLLFYRAEVLFKREQWGEAALAYAAYRAKHDGTAFMAVSALRQGLALEMDGRRRRAEQAYAQVRADREFDADEAAARDADKLLASPLSGFEKQLLLARVSHDRSDYARAEDLLVGLEDSVDVQPVVVQAEWAYRLGRTLDETDRDDEAADLYRRAIDRPGDPQAKWAAYGLYYLARIHEDAGRRAEALAVYQAVIDYEGGYDYRGTNEQRARFGLRRLEGES